MNVTLLKLLGRKVLNVMAGQKHVDYILAAEFHVDTGPMIAHQYPEPLSGDVK